MIPIRFIPAHTAIPFTRLGRWAVWASLLMMLACVVLVVGVGLNFGIDFKGGLLMQVHTQQSTQGRLEDVAHVRAVLARAHITDANIQSLGDDSFIIRVDTAHDAHKSDKVKQALGPTYTIDSLEIIGPQVSRELIYQGMVAILIAVGLMMVYVAFRFDWQFGVGAIVALFHDVLATLGILALTRYEIGLPTIAALLTIVGYSMNDTVVVFDRIRDNRVKYPNLSLAHLVDRSVNETLSRTIMTSTTTLLSLVALFFFGGAQLASFTFTIGLGIVIGTYSSIFIASPVLVFLNKKGI